MAPVLPGDLDDLPPMGRKSTRYFDTTPMGYAELRRMAHGGGLASVILASMDDQPLTGSRKMLLSTCVRAGTLPGSPAIESVTGAIRLRQLRAGKQLTVYALDGAGRNREKIRVMENDDGERVSKIGTGIVTSLSASTTPD